MTAVTAANFPIDTRIVLKASHNRKGEVIGNQLRHGDQIVAVEWDDGSLSKVNVHDIQTEDSLADEFRNYKAQVNAKIEEAAASLNAAAELARTKGNDLQEWDNNGRLFSSVLSLMEVMDDLGWRTSSMNC